jgi:hypothetical protein
MVRSFVLSVAFCALAAIVSGEEAFIEGDSAATTKAQPKKTPSKTASGTFSFPQGTRFRDHILLIGVHNSLGSVHS